MCSGATQRNKAPYWIQGAWVNVRLGHKPQETGGEERRNGESVRTEERMEEIKRKRGWERRDGLHEWNHL